MRLIDADKLIDDYNKSDGTISDLMELILDAAEEAAPPNNPLTLEELREMDGEPVWNDAMKKWVLVDLYWEYGERAVDAGGDWRGLDDRCYRRRPEAQP